MNYKTHLVGGVGAGLVLVASDTFLRKIIPIDGLITGVVYGAGLIVGSLCPDIDKKESKLGKMFYPVSATTEMVAGHRGITHAPIIQTIIYGLLLILGQLAGADSAKAPFFAMATGLYIGTLSHIFLDMLTPSGIPLLYPFTKKRVSLLSISTGSVMETIFRWVLIILIAVGAVRFYA